MKKLFLVAISMMIFSFTDAQYVKEFSQDTSKYIQELNDMFGTSLMEDEEIIFNNFITTWDSISSDSKNEIMLISDLMRERSCRPRPQYIMFINILDEFFLKKKLDLGYDAWIKGYKSFMENEKTLLKNINAVNQSVLVILQKSMLYNSVSS